MDFQELFHWYVPEYDYKLPLSEMDKWNIFVNVCVFVALIVAVLIFGLFCKLKHRWLVNAKCAFCNCVVRIWRAKLYWWFCNRCQRINGYPKSWCNQNDFSSSMEEMKEMQEHKDVDLKVKLMNVCNNKIHSPTNRQRITYPKNNLNDMSTIISHSRTAFQDKYNDLIPSKLQDENNNQIDTSFQKIKSKIKQMLKINHDIEKFSNDADDDWSTNTNSNSTRLPVEMSNLRKMHVKLILDDVNRRFELLSAEKALCAKMRQMKKMEKSLHDAKENAAQDNRYFPNESLNKTYTHSIRRRNTFFERTLNHSITSQTPNTLNNEEIRLKKNAASARLATLEAHLTELRNMHANEIESLKSHIENKASILKKLEYLKCGMIDFYEKIEEERDRLNVYQSAPPFSSTAQEFRFEQQNQISHSASESGYLSESGEVKNPKSEMSIIVEEGDNAEKIVTPHHVHVLKKTLDRFKQDNEESTSVLTVAKRKSRVRIVKPIRPGQRPVAKALPSNSTQQ